MNGSNLVVKRDSDRYAEEGIYFVRGATPPLVTEHAIPIDLIRFPLIAMITYLRTIPSWLMTAFEEHAVLSFEYILSYNS